MLSISIRNREAEPAYVTLQVMAFDARGALKGTARLCLGDAVGGTSRAGFLRPLEFRGVTTRDAVVVFVHSVVTERATWVLAEPLEEQIEKARRRADLTSVRLTMQRTRTSGLPEILCPCECDAIEAMCRETCGQRLESYTCTDAFDACTASCTCGREDNGGDAF